MTEREWLACADPVPMLAHLGERPRDRRCRLFALACCQRVRRFITDPRSVAALDFAERHVERGAAGRKGRRAIEEAAAEVYPALDKERDRTRDADPVRFAEVLVAIGGCLAAQRLVSLGDDSAAASAVSEYLASSAAFERALLNHGDAPEWDEEAMGPEMAEQAKLVRDIFGNPFRAVSVERDWLAWGGGAVVKLAQEIYAEGDFGSLPVLADALEDAGCANADVLDHCRSEGPHVRGCWVVDLLLGKE